MSWGKLDDQFWRNAKVKRLRAMGPIGREALGVWVYWLSWCLGEDPRTGVVPFSEFPGADEKAAKFLVEVKLWQKRSDGYYFNDFPHYNPPKGDDREEKKRRADADRMADKRAAEKRAKEATATNQSEQSSDVACDSRATVADESPSDVASDTHGDADDDTHRDMTATGEFVARATSRARVDPNSQSPVPISQSPAPLQACEPITKRMRRRESPPLPEPDARDLRDEPDAHEQRVEFQAAVMRRFRSLCRKAGMGDPPTAGKDGTLPERLANTAQDMGVDPIELLERTHAAWVAAGADGAADFGPWPAFCARFTRLATGTPRDGFLRSSTPEGFKRGDDGKDFWTKLRANDG